MSDYLKWDEKIIHDFSDATINPLYNDGYLFTRIGKGVMQQTRSVRVDLSKFELSSENRRIFRKTDGLTFDVHTIPYAPYHWSMAKMAKDFYDNKFGEGTFTANKMKELMTDPDQTNFNRVFIYTFGNTLIGYCIALETDEILHYCYPFYDLQTSTKDTGLGMMLRAIITAKKNNKKYAYLGSFQRPTDTYKLQFAGVEWWDGKEWKNDIEELKKEYADIRKFN